MAKENTPDLETKHTVVVPGLPEVGRAIENATDAVVTENTVGLRKFLNKLCGPAAEQYGEAWADRVKQFRYLNHVKFLSKAQKLHEELGVNPNFTVKPRLMLDVIEASSMEEDDRMQDWWAGLSISSIEQNPSDDNLIFINMMKQITSTQRTLISHICSNAEIMHTASNLLIANEYSMPHEDLVSASGINDINKLDREIDSLHSLGLLQGGGYNLHSVEMTANLTPSPLCLHFYARCNGRTENLIEFLGATLTEKCPRCGRKH